MGLRVGLHEELCKILGSFGVWLWDPFNFKTDTTQSAIDAEARKHVYFQPPTGFLMSYPCIVYSLSKMDAVYANNGKYQVYRAYSVTVIDKIADSVIPDKVLALPFCRFDRSFVSDNLYHFCFTIYY